MIYMMAAKEFANADEVRASAAAVRSRLRALRAPGAMPRPRSWSYAPAPLPIRPETFVPPVAPITPSQQRSASLAKIREAATRSHDWLNIDYTPLDVPVVVLKQEWRRIVAEVAAKHSVTVMDIIGPHRRQDIVKARFEAFYRVRNETPLSHPEIGRRLGGKDHTTVLYGIRKHIERTASA